MMRQVGYVLLFVIAAALIWFGGMQYADRDAWTCQYVGGVTDSTLFESKAESSRKVLVKGNLCGR